MLRVVVVIGFTLSIEPNEPSKAIRPHDARSPLTSDESEDEEGGHRGGGGSRAIGVKVPMKKKGALEAGPSSAAATSDKKLAKGMIKVNRGEAGIKNRVDKASKLPAPPRPKSIFIDQSDEDDSEDLPLSKKIKKGPPLGINSQTNPSLGVNPKKVQQGPPLGLNHNKPSIAPPTRPLNPPMVISPGKRVDAKTGMHPTTAPPNPLVGSLVTGSLVEKKKKRDNGMVYDSDEEREEGKGKRPTGLDAKKARVPAPIGNVVAKEKGKGEQENEKEAKPTPHASSTALAPTSKPTPALASVPTPKVPPSSSFPALPSAPYCPPVKKPVAPCPDPFLMAGVSGVVATGGPRVVWGPSDSPHDLLGDAIHTTTSYFPVKGKERLEDSLKGQEGPKDSTRVIVPSTQARNPSAPIPQALKRVSDETRVKVIVVPTSTIAASAIVGAARAGSANVGTEASKGVEATIGSRVPPSSLPHPQPPTFPLPANPETNQSRIVCPNYAKGPDRCD